MLCSQSAEEESFFDKLMPKESGVAKVWPSLQPKQIVESSM